MIGSVLEVCKSGGMIRELRASSCGKMVDVLFLQIGLKWELPCHHVCVGGRLCPSLGGKGFEKVMK